MIYDDAFRQRYPVMTAVPGAAAHPSIARGDTPVRDGDEVAFFPPVTGG